MFVLTTVLSFALLSIVLLSVLNSSLLFSVDSSILIIDLIGSFTSGLTKSIFYLRFLSKIWFPQLTELLWELCCIFANNDSMINCLSLSCRFRLSICSFKAVTSAELLFEHFYSVWVVTISGVSVLQDAPFITIGSRSSKILTDSDVDSPELDSFWSKYIYKKTFWSYVWYMRPFFSSKCCFHENKIGASKFQKYSWNKKVGNFFLHYTRR